MNPFTIPKYPEQEKGPQNSSGLPENELEEDKEDPEALASELAYLIRTHWEEAKRCKYDVEQSMLKSLRRLRQTYDPDKLSAMRLLYGEDYDPPYLPLVLTKTNAAKAWIEEVLFTQVDLPFLIEPTDEPTPPPEELSKITQEVLSNISNTMAIARQSTGNDPAFMANLQAQMPEIFKKELKEAIEKWAKEENEALQTRFKDILYESDWFTALNQVIDDIVDYNAGILKGPIFRQKPEMVFEIDPLTGKSVPKVKNKVVMTYERRSPFDIYPAPKSTGINDGYLIDHITIRKNDLALLKDVPGYNADEIDKVLEEFETGGLVEWTNITTEKDTIEDNPDVSSADTISCLEYWNNLKGSYLIDNGLLFEDTDKTIPIKENSYYEICAWLIGTHVVQLILNPDPQGFRPFSKASWIENNGLFWGRGVPEILAPIEDICNSITRNIVINSSFAAGPLTEINTDRVDITEARGIWPLKMFKCTSAQMVEAPAVRFTPIPFVGDRLLNVLNNYIKLADEMSVPAYVHGDTDIAGAGRTFSGLSLIYKAASRSIKQVIANIDHGIIENSLKLHYKLAMIYGMLEDIPDIKIKATGSVSMVFREQMISRLIELYNYSGRNPKILETVVRLMGFDPKDYDLTAEQAAQAMQPQSNLQLPQPAARQPDGSLYGGQDNAPA